MSRVTSTTVNARSTQNQVQPSKRRQPRDQQRQKDNQPSQDEAARRAQLQRGLFAEDDSLTSPQQSELDTLRFDLRSAGSKALTAISGRVRAEVLAKRGEQEE